MRLALNLKESSYFLVKILNAIDSLMVVSVLWIFIHVHKIEWNEYYSYLAAGSFPVSFFFFYSVELYRPWRGIRLYKEFIAILKGWALIVGTILSLFFILKISHYFSRAVIISWVISAPFVIFFSHLGIRNLLKMHRKLGKNLRYAVIIGAGNLGLRLASYIERIQWAGIKVIGFFDDYKSSKDLSGTKYPVLGTIDQVQDYLTINNNIDYVYIALPLRSQPKIVSILNKCRTFGSKIFMVPDIFAYSVFNADFQSLGDMLLINFNPDYRWKRHFDIIFSLVAILVTSPLSLLIALLIKLEDGGPIFYGHKRITMAGKTFNCWKFRTMVADADIKLQEILTNNPAAREEWEKTFKLKQDPRITKVGRFLRKLSLDELPQFFNILVGDMSVVGARPIVEKELKNYYNENAGLYCSLKPGLTGPWQISLRNDMQNYDDKVEKDLWYLQNISFLLDLKIIFKTVHVVLMGKGAY